MGKIIDKNTPAIICLLIAALCFSSSSRADMREPELFEKAYGYYLAFNPEKALETFDLFLRQFPESSALDSIYFWRAKALMQLKRNEEAAKGFRTLREVFPESSYSFFAEKELETLNRPQKSSVKSDVAREKTQRTADAKMQDYADRILTLETEKAELARQLADAEKKALLTEKGLSKALDDKNALESQLDSLKRNRDELAKKTTALEAGNKESTAWLDEKKALESRLKVSEEKVASLSHEVAAGRDSTAAMTKEHSGKVQQSEINREKLELQIKELKAEKTTLVDTLKEKDKAIADSQQTILVLKNSSTEAQSSKQRDIENMNQQISQLASDKALLQNEIAVEKKKSDELLLKLHEKDKTMQHVLSDESQRKSAEVSAQERLKQKDDELARMRVEKDGLQSRINALEIRDRERTDLAQHAEDARKLREEAVLSAAELARLQKENARLLEEKTALGLGLSKTEEKTKALLSKDKESEREKNALLTKAQEIGKKLAESEARMRLLSDERRKLDAEAKEKDQKLAKALDSNAVLEKRRQELEKENESSRKLNEKTTRFGQEKAAIEGELIKERKNVADLTAKNAENEASLFKERKALEQIKKELDVRDREKAELAGQAAEARKFREEIAVSVSRIDKIEKDNKRMVDEKQVLERSLKDAEERLKTMSAKADGERTGEIKVLSEKLLDAENKLKDYDLALRKSNEERLAAEARLQQDQSKLKKSEESIVLLEKTLKGSELEKKKKIAELTERIRTLDTEKRVIGEELTQEKRKTAELSGKATEKETALLKNVQMIESSRQDLEARLAAEKTQREADRRKSEAERADLKNSLKELEAQSVMAKDVSAQLQDSRKKQDELSRISAAAEKEISQLKSAQAELESRLAASEETARNLSSARQSEGLALQDKQKAERQLQEKDEQIAKDREALVRLEKHLKERDSENTASLHALNEKLTKALQENKQLGAALTEKQTLEQAGFSKMQNELVEIKRLNEGYAKKNAEIDKKIEELTMQMKEYDKPFVRIGQDRLSLSSIVRDGTASRQLTDKIGAKSVPWRTGNIIDDSINEQVMARKAAEQGLVADAAAMQSITRQFALSTAEGTYLARYLVVDALCRKMTSAPAITEKDAREYYEKHKDHYAGSSENLIKLLSVAYDKSDELDKSLLAVEIQQEAQSGKPFESIANSRSASVAMREMTLSRLPDWVRLRVAGLKRGEISDIIAVDNELMVIQVMGERPLYRPFDEVKKEINAALSAEQTGREQAFHDWLNSLRKDIEFLR